MNPAVHSLILLIQLCSADLCSREQRQALAVATQNCPIGGIECVAERLATGRIEQSGDVTILRGR